MAQTDRLTLCIPAETYLPEVNGAATFAARLAEGLARRGHEVHVIAPSPTGNPGYANEDGVHVHRVRAHRWYPHPTWTICFPWETRPEMSRLLDDIRPDVVHTQAHFVIGRFAFSLAHARGIPVVATNHFMPDNVRPYVRAPKSLVDAGAAAAWWDLRRIFETADHITVPTQLAADLLTENGFRAPVQAVSCGIDLSHFRESAPEAPHGSGEQAAGGPAAGEAPEHDRPTVLFVGRLSKEKHIEDIVGALALTDPALDLHLEVVGAGDQDTLIRERAAELGVADRVRLLGKVSAEDLVRAYHRATFFCMPGTAELQSIATLEALASGTPVVLADAVALPHLCRDGENGYLVEPRNTEKYAEAFTKILTASDQERAAMGRAARAVAATHDIEYTLDTFEGIYREVLARCQR